MAMRRPDSNNEDFFDLQGKPKVSLLATTGFFILELLKVVIISLAIIIPVRFFLIQPFYVKGASMEPNFYDNEYLVIDEISYRFKDPARGEIIVFRYPKDPREYFIKRIIGLPGEKVAIKNGNVYINGVRLDESEYLAPEEQTIHDGVWMLKADEYFILGDNRQYSLDSRKFGPVDRSYIIGRAWVRGWPFDKLTVFEIPAYNL
jgi:signal peptidase I